MNYEFLGEHTFIGEDIYEVTVRLIPENESERKAIRNVEIGKANSDEQELINNYLLFGLRDWSTLSVKNQVGTIFKVKATNILVCA